MTHIWESQKSSRQEMADDKFSFTQRNTAEGLLDKSKLIKPTIHSVPEEIA